MFVMGASRRGGNGVGAMKLREKVRRRGFERARRVPQVEKDSSLGDLMIRRLREVSLQSGRMVRVNAS